MADGNIKSGNSFRIRPSSGNRNALLPENTLEREVAYQTNNNRIYELEKSLLSFKDYVQGKLSRLPDPRNELKAMMDRQSVANKQLTVKVNWLQQALKASRQAERGKDLAHNATIGEMQKKLDILQFKYKNLESSTSVLDNLRHASLSTPKQSEGGRSGNGGANPNQLKMLRELLAQEKRVRENFQQSWNRQVEQLTQKNLRLEKDLYSVLNQQHEQRLAETRAKKDAQYSNQKSRKDQLSSEYAAMRVQISSVQKRIEQLQSVKVGSEGSLKQYVDGVAQKLKQELQYEQKVAVTNSAALARETNQSLESLYGLVQTNKQQQQSAMNQTQNLVAENIKALASTVDLLKQEIYTKVASLPSLRPPNPQGSELKSKIVDALGAMEARLKEVQQALLQEKAKAEEQNHKIYQAVLKRLEDQQLAMNIWKSELQKKNLAIFKQISGTLKVLKGELGKEKQQSSFRDKDCLKAVESATKTLRLQITDAISAAELASKPKFAALEAKITQSNTAYQIKLTAFDQEVNQRLSRLRAQIKDESMEQLKVKYNELITSIQRMESKIQQSSSIRLQKEISFLKDLIAQKEATTATELTMLGEVVKQSSLKIDNEVNQLIKKHYAFVNKYEDSQRQLQAGQAKLRDKFQAELKNYVKETLETSTKRNEYVVEGMRKALHLNSLKDKTEVLEKVEQLKHQAIRTSNTLKYELTTDFYARLENQASERIEQQNQLKSNIEFIDSSLRSYVTNEIDNLKRTQDQTQESLKNTMAAYSTESISKNNQLNAKVDVFIDKVQTSQYLKDLYLNSTFEDINIALKHLLQTTDNQQNDIKILKEVKKEIDDIQSQFYELEDRFSKSVEVVTSKLQSQIYSDRQFLQASLDQQKTHGGEMLNTLQALNKKIYSLQEDMNESDNRIDIVQKAIKHTSEFLNTLDVRLTMEQMYSKISQQQIWEFIYKQQQKEVAK